MSARSLAQTACLIVLGMCLPFVAACAPASGSAASARHAVPPPAQDATLAVQPRTETAVLAGGCFWGLQWVFEHVPGVSKVTSGYSGGAPAHPSYQQVSTGDTGHAETVEISFDPSRVSFGQLLRVYFSVATDPTELDRQGPDTGTQYRGVIFYTDAEQERIAHAYIAQLTAAHAYSAPIVTEVVPFRAFYRAEDYHQDYARLHPDAPYIAYNDAPKVIALQRELPALYRATPVIWHGEPQDPISVELH